MINGRHQHAVTCPCGMPQAHVKAYRYWTRAADVQGMSHGRCDAPGRRVIDNNIMPYGVRSRDERGVLTVQSGLGRLLCSAQTLRSVCEKCKPAFAWPET